MRTFKQPIEVLLIEDNPGDVLLTQLALKNTKLIGKLNVVEDGAEAIAYLRKEGKYARACTPDLIILDLNLPKVDGREVLATIKADPELSVLPVVVLTTSDHHKDIVECYKAHANCFITKPLDLDMFADTVRSIEQFWLSITELPTRA